jgi:hypothetical protein
MAAGDKPSTITNDYYMFPIRPGKVNFLAGTMGELRSTHFHAGIDIKTGGVEGLNVYAAADGYVSRIKISSGGYGNTLYVAHPNGTTTVYAHLKRFADNVADYVLKKQYQQKTFRIELFPEKGQFPVKKGDIIASSGNTGSSSGPHLHFEIRDANQLVLNPLSFGFKEIKDDIPPIVRKLSLVTKETNARINGQFGYADFNLSRSGRKFYTADTIRAFGKIGIELYVHDKLNGAPNNNGFPCMELRVNGNVIYDHFIEKLSFAQQKNIYVFSNYERMRKTGRKYNKLYIDDGNELSFYKNPQNRGFLSVRQDSVYLVEVVLNDSYGNESTVNFVIKGSSDPAFQVQRYEGKRRFRQLDIQDNTLIYSASLQKNYAPITELYVNRQKIELLPEYIYNGKAIYIWDLRLGLPDSINNCEEIIYPKLAAQIPSNTRFDYFDEYLNGKFNSNTLFDTIYLAVDYVYDSANGMEIFKFGNPYDPVRKGFRLNLKPKQILENNTEYEVYAKYGRSYSYEGGTWKGNEISFYTNRFGTYTLLRDSVAPTITPIALSSDKLRFVIKDDLSGIDRIECHVNGAWVLMNYDHKKRLIWSEKLDKTIPFRGELTLEISDKTGNINTYQSKI